MNDECLKDIINKNPNIKEEVIKLIKKALYSDSYDIYINRFPDNTVNSIDEESFNNWINKNL